MAYDVQRFNELTKQMSAYAHYARDGHLQLAAARARRRDRARQLAEQINSQLRLRFRAGGGGLAGRLRLASSCSTPTTPPTRPPAASSTAHAKRAERLAERDERAARRSAPRATRTAATAPPVPTPSGGACQTPPGRWTADASRAPRLHTRAACSSVVLGDVDADLLVAEQLAERVAELGGVIKQARPGVRLAGEAVQDPLRDLAAAARAARRRCETAVGPVEIGQVGRHQRDRAALQHAAEDHHVAARVLDRRRAPLTATRPRAPQDRPARASSLAIIAASGDAPPGTAWSPPAPRAGGSCGRSNRPSGAWLGSPPVKQKTAPGLAAGSRRESGSSA